MDKDLKVGYKNWSTEKKNKVAIICLIIFACWAWLMYGGKPKPSNSELYAQASQARFDEIKSSSPELDSIQIKSTSSVVFKYNTIPEDLEFTIRANTVTFSNFNLANLDNSTGVVTVSAEYQGKEILSCYASNGRVESCRKN